MIWMVIIMVLLLLALCFAFAYNFGEIKTKKILNKLRLTLEKDENERRWVQAQNDRDISDARSTTASLILSFIFTAAMFVIALMAYRDDTLIKYIKGNIESETIVRTKYRGNVEPQIDTVYNFYKVKKEK